MSAPASLALAECLVARPCDGVEVVLAAPADRRFPARVGDQLGICWKRGPAHVVRADGRDLVYPSDAICIRAPGCVWSTEHTGPSSFASIDVDRALLPEGTRAAPMTFLPARALLDVETLAHALADERDAARAHERSIELVLALARTGVLETPVLRARAKRRVVDAALDVLEARLDAPPRLDALADEVGENKFTLLRQFRRELGISPGAYVTALRVARARVELAAGATPAEVAARWGFVDQAHLTRRFREIVGLPPGAYARLGRRQSRTRPSLARPAS